MQLYATTAYCFSTNCERHGKSIDAIDFILHKKGCSKHDDRGVASVKVGAGKPDFAVRPHEIRPRTEQQSAGVPGRARAGGVAGSRLQPRHLYKGLRQCVVFGLRNEAGEALSLYGRAVHDKVGRHYYSRNRRGLYPSYPGQKTKCLILTESVIDAATLVQHTEETVLVMYGTDGLTDEHLEALDNQPELEEIVLFQDGDAAGEAAAVKWGEVLHNRYPKLTISRVATPEGEDVNSLVISHEAAILVHLIGEGEVLFSSPEPASNEVPSDEEKKARPQVQRKRRRAMNSTRPNPSSSTGLKTTSASPSWAAWLYTRSTASKSR